MRCPRLRRKINIRPNSRQMNESTLRCKPQQPVPVLQTAKAFVEQPYGIETIACAKQSASRTCAAPPDQFIHEWMLRAGFMNLWFIDSFAVQRESGYTGHYPRLGVAQGLQLPRKLVGPPTVIGVEKAT